MYLSLSSESFRCYSYDAILLAFCAVFAYARLWLSSMLVLFNTLFAKQRGILFSIAIDPDR